MPFLVGIAAAIAAALGITVTTLIIAVSALVSAILVVVGSLTGIQALTIAGLVVGFVGFAYAIGNVATFVIQVHGLSLWSIGQIITRGISFYLQAVQTGLHAIASATHFYLALKVHRIAWLVSPQYRQLMRTLTHNLVSMGQDLGWGAATMLLLFNDARNIVLTVSGMLGRSYDLSQVIWLQRMKDVLTWVDIYINRDAFSYNLFIDLLDNFIFKPYTNMTQGWFGGLVGSIDSTLKGVTAMAQTVSRLDQDFRQFIGDIPGDLGVRINRAIRPIWTEIDKFYDVYLWPNIDRLDQAIDVLTANTGQLQDDMVSQLRRLLYPGNYLAEIDNFSGVDRRWQEDLLGDLASRSYSRMSGSWTGYVGPQHDDWQRMIDALAARQHPPRWSVREAEGLRFPAGVAPKPRDTWNVGDY